MKRAAVAPEDVGFGPDYDDEEDSFMEVVAEAARIALKWAFCWPVLLPLYLLKRKAA